MEDWLDRIKSKNLIFTATSGRSGTEYLSYLLSLLKDFKSEHEAAPCFHDYYRSIQKREYSYEEYWIKEKLPHIASIKEQYYADVSHVACKGFLGFLLELGLKPSLIILRRNNRDIAKSLWRLGTIPFRSDSGLQYLSSPYDDDSLKINADIASLTDYQLCYWYTLDINKRQEKYKQDFLKAGSKVVEVSFLELTKGNGFSQIRNELDLPNLKLYDSLRFYKNKRRAKNSKMLKKKPLEMIDFDFQEQQLHKMIFE